MLAAMGQSAVQAGAAVRVTLGRENTAAEVQRFLTVLRQSVTEIRRSQH